MSTAVDARRRPSLWSYISFGTAPRRRSISLPTRNNGSHDSYQKSGSIRGGKVNSHREDAWMTPSQRSRYYKSGAIIALVVFILYLFSGKKAAGVGDLVKGTRMQLRSFPHATPQVILIGIRPWRPNCCRSFCGDGEVLKAILFEQTFNTVCPND